MAVPNSQDVDSCGGKCAIERHTGRSPVRVGDRIGRGIESASLARSDEPPRSYQVRCLCRPRGFEPDEVTFLSDFRWVEKECSMRTIQNTGPDLIATHASHSTQSSTTSPSQPTTRCRSAEVDHSRPRNKNTSTSRALKSGKACKQLVTTHSREESGQAPTIRLRAITVKPHVQDAGRLKEVPSTLSSPRGRFCVHDRKDPDTRRLQVFNPTPHTERLMLALQITANLGFDLAVGNCEEEFCQSRPLQRQRGPLFVTPCHGLGLSPEVLIELRIAGCTTHPPSSRPR